MERKKIKKEMGRFENEKFEQGLRKNTWVLTEQIDWNEGNLC